MATQTLAAMQRVGRDLADLQKEKWVNITVSILDGCTWSYAPGHAQGTGMGHVY